MSFFPRGVYKEVSDPKVGKALTKFFAIYYLYAAEKAQKLMKNEEKHTKQKKFIN